MAQIGIFGWLLLPFAIVSLAQFLWKVHSSNYKTGLLVFGIGLMINISMILTSVFVIMENMTYVMYSLILGMACVVCRFIIAIIMGTKVRTTKEKREEGTGPIYLKKFKIGKKSD